MAMALSLAVGPGTGMVTCARNKNNHRRRVKCVARAESKRSFLFFSLLSFCILFAFPRFVSTLTSSVDHAAG